MIITTTAAPTPSEGVHKLLQESNRGVREAGEQLLLEHLAAATTTYPTSVPTAYARQRPLVPTQRPPTIQGRQWEAWFGTMHSIASG